MLEREWLHYGECVPFTRRFNATISKTVVRERKEKREREEGGRVEGEGGGRNGKIGKRREVIAGRRNDGREDGLKHFYSFFVSPLSKAVA